MLSMKKSSRGRISSNCLLETKDLHKVFTREYSLSSPDRGRNPSQGLLEAGNPSLLEAKDFHKSSTSFSIERSPIRGLLEAEKFYRRSSQSLLDSEDLLKVF